MMTKISVTSAALAIAGASYIAGSWRAPHEIVSAEARHSGRTVLYYMCPMHPKVTSRTSGTTPCCGMDFEPVYSDVPEAGGVSSQIPVSAAQQQLIGVAVGTAVHEGGVDRLRAFGRVAAEETRIFRITAGVEAYISAISGVTTGASVSKGQWLASYSSADVRVPISAFITSINVLEREQNSGHPDPAGLASARTSVSLATDRLLAMGMPPGQIDEIRANRATGTTIKVTSPVDGFVLARNVASGQRFDAGTELFQLADLQRVWILADVPVADANRIKPGTPARIRSGGRDVGIRAHVSTTVPPQFDPATQSFKLRLDADNPGLGLRPDMFVDVDFEVPFPPALLVPADAVVMSGLHSRVFVERGAGVFEPRDIETGPRHGDRVAVVKGLAPGDRLAISGAFLLDSETRMKADDRPHH